MYYDYFDHRPQDSADVDYIQAYYDIHDHYEEELGHEIYWLSRAHWKLFQK